MNFNLALICTDGSFADAGALCASSARGRSHHPASASGALGAVLSPCWFRDISLGPATTAQIGETKDTWKVGKSFRDAQGIPMWCG